MEDYKANRKCTNIGCIKNTGILNFGKIHYQELSEAEMRCTLENPRVTETESFWYCEDEEMYNNLGV